MNILVYQLMAQSIENPILGSDLAGLTGAEFIQGLIRALINLGLVVGVTVFFFMLLLGAIQWISSGGDKGAAESARGRITNALVGLVILLAVFGIMNLVEIFFGVKLLYFNLDSLQIVGGVGGGGPPPPAPSPCPPVCPI